jgi:phenylacetate-CoA ligase
MDYVGELRRRRAPWIHGYPSVITLIAKFINDNSVDLGYSVRWVTIGAENLTPHQSSAIAAAFGVNPIQHYGMTEAIGNISQDTDGCLYVDEDFAALEFEALDNTGRSRIIGSNFTNYAFPLIRYEVGDVCSPADTVDSHGRRRVLSLDGRREDYLILPSGRKLGRLDHIFKDMINIKEAQIYQRDPSQVLFRIVKGPRYQPADEDLLLYEARKRLGDEIRISIQYLSSIQRTATGKLRFVVSDCGTLPAGSPSEP